MAERRAMNKYYPPEWTPDKGSINSFRGQHPLRERARKLDQGILIVRFEMPYNVWCLGCNEHIGKGVRYNAEKKQVGNYFTTKIWSFRMKCHLCSNWMEMQTDPKISDYVAISGVKRKVETWDEEDAGTIKIADEEEAQKLAEDPFYKLEHAVADKQRASEAAPKLEKLIELKAVEKDDFALSQIMRKRLREDKKEAKKQKEEAEAKGIMIPLLPESEEDKLIAKQIKFKSKIVPSVREDQKTQKALLQASSIFSSSKPIKSSKDLDAKKKQQLELLKKRKLASGAVHVTKLSRNDDTQKPTSYLVPHIKSV